MRLRLVLVLLLLLPLQFAWAATTGYCAHESGSGTGHFGHHEHRHQAAASVDPDTATPDHKPAALTGEDLDCSFCHLGCVQPLASHAPVMVLNESTLPQIDWSASGFASPSPDSIERPKWKRSA